MVRSGLGEVADRPYQGRGRGRRAVQGRDGPPAQGPATHHQGQPAQSQPGTRGLGVLPQHGGAALDPGFQPPAPGRSQFLRLRWHQLPCAARGIPRPRPPGRPAAGHAFRIAGVQRPGRPGSGGQGPGYGRPRCRARSAGLGRLCHPGRVQPGRAGPPGPGGLGLRALGRAPGACRRPGRSRAGFPVRPSGRHGLRPRSRARRHRAAVPGPGQPVPRHGRRPGHALPCRPGRLGSGLGSGFRAGTGGVPAATVRPRCGGGGRAAAAGDPLGPARHRLRQRRPAGPGARPGARGLGPGGPQLRRGHGAVRRWSIVRSGFPADRAATGGADGRGRLPRPAGDHERGDGLGGAHPPGSRRFGFQRGAGQSQRPRPDRHQWPGGSHRLGGSGSGTGRHPGAAAAGGLRLPFTAGRGLRRAFHGLPGAPRLRAGPGPGLLGRLRRTL